MQYGVVFPQIEFGNDVQAISIDGAGYRGPVLRELTDPDGLNLAVFTPPMV